MVVCIKQFQGRGAKAKVFKETYGTTLKFPGGRGGGGICKPKKTFWEVGIFSGTTHSEYLGYGQQNTIYRDTFSGSELVFHVSFKISDFSKESEVALIYLNYHWQI